MPTLFRMQVVLKHRSGLSRDNAVNNIWVWDDDAVAPAVEPLAEAVRNFWTVPTAGGGGWAGMFLYGYQIADTGHEVRAYRYDTETGDRLPYVGAPPDHVEVFDFLGRPARVAAGALPSEVAVCMSFANVGTSATPASRRRGRIFLGPLDDTAITRDTGGRAAPAANTITRVNEAGNELADRLRVLLGATAGWVVYSRPYAGRGEIVRPGRTTLPAIPARDGSVHLVNQVSVDNALDTMRSRGERPTARTSIVA